MGDELNNREFVGTASKAIQGLCGNIVLLMANSSVLPKDKKIFLKIICIALTNNIANV